MAFVSACQSEQIGQIFLDAGIPAVIAVNSETQIMDEVCKSFSKMFYKHLLNGGSIENSFNLAKTEVEQNPEFINDTDFQACCCAHKHKEDCQWYQFFLEDPNEAH